MRVPDTPNMVPGGVHKWGPRMTQNGVFPGGVNHREYSDLGNPGIWGSPQNDPFPVMYRFGPVLHGISSFGISLSRPLGVSGRGPEGPRMLQEGSRMGSKTGYSEEVIYGGSRDPVDRT